MPRFKQAREIKVGVVGYGGAFSMGHVHLREMQAAGMTPTAVAEIDPDRLKTAEEDFPGIETYPSVSAMLKGSDVDLVAVITPHNTHARIALACLRAGRHVVCEKPFAITTAECDAMLAAAKKHRCLVTAYHNRHWDGCIRQTVKTLAKGVIGDVVRIEAHLGGWGCPGDWWRTSKSISGGILYDWGVHLLEYSLQLIDADMTEVSGFARCGVWRDQTPWGDDTNEDEGFVVVRFKTGQWLTLSISNIDSNPKPCTLEITGTRGTYLMSEPTYEVVTHRRGGETVTTHGRNPAHESWRFYRNVAEHLVEGCPLTITGEWARRPIHILDLADRSARSGRALKTKYA